MKVIAIIVLSIMCSFSPIQQPLNSNRKQLDEKNIIGVWQAKSDEMTSGWLDTYQFFANGEFTFNPSQYDGLKRIISIKGKYRIIGDSLFFLVQYTKEATGGDIVRSETSTLSDSWALEGVKIIEIKHENKEEQKAAIELGQPSANGNSCILIDKRKYYKMQSDPTKYQ